MTKIEPNGDIKKVLIQKYQCAMADAEVCRKFAQLYDQNEVCVSYRKIIDKMDDQQYEPWDNAKCFLNTAETYQDVIWLL